MSDKIRVAVIGAGRLGSSHARVYKELTRVNLIGVCDTEHSRALSIASSLQTQPFYNYKDLFGKVQAVSIATPTITHHKVAKDFLLAGINVLVEKPFTATLKEADDLLSIARKNKLLVQVGHIERFNSAFTAIKHICEQPKFIEVHRLSGFPGRSLDIGVVLDLMIHDIDIVLGLVNSPVKRIEAVGINVLTSYEDIANARISFKNGCVCNLTASRISDELIRKIRIFLKDTYVSLDYKNEEADIYRKDGDKITKEAIWIKKEEPLKKELSSFLDCVIHKNKPLVSGIEGRRALEVALHIQRLIWKRK
jgi:predicted dehydrogenase